MRPSYFLFFLLVLLLSVDGYLYLSAQKEFAAHSKDQGIMRQVVATFGLSDLAVSTEARYTRHPAVSDTMAPFMDHPGSIEHFPTGSFWYPVKK